MSSYLGLRANMAGQMLDCYKIQEIMSVFAASPISPLRHASGIFAGFLIVEAVSLPPLAVLGILIGDTGLAIISLLASPPLLLISTNFGIFIGLGIRSPTNVSAITNTVTGILTIPPPVFYPAEVLPRGVREIALLTPTACTAELARVLVGLGSSVDIPRLAAVEVLWISVSTALVAKVPKWGRQ